MPLRTSMTLPPTPTSPHGVQDYSQHNKLQQQQQHQPFSLEMMLAEHGATGGFQSVGMDASLAAAVYGIGMGSGVNDSLPPQLLSSSMLAAAAAAAASNGHGDLAHQGGQHQQQHSYGSNEGRGMHMASDNNSVPIVFKSSVQNPPTISPSTFFGGDSGAAPATERSYITLHGLNFTPDMVVVFDGQHSLFTEFKSSESISCLGPLATDFADDSAAEDTVVAASNDNSGDDDDYRMEEYAMLDGSKRQQGQHPTSPSESDSSLAANSSSAQSSVDSANKPRSLRASSTDSTASSATATLSSHGSSAPLKKSGAAASRGSLAKRSGSVVKVPIYLSRNGGAGPTFKTGQFYTLQM
ncbi:hypothetical protein GGI10_005966 [Coemansia sp. RSA 2530]|nr:hypothetical protein GGI10_005966 [Coemansia sp. RSA 2530]